MKLNETQLNKIKELTGYTFDELLVKPPNDFIRITWGLFNNKKINKAQYDWLHQVREADRPKVIVDDNPQDTIEIIEHVFPEVKQVSFIPKDKLTVRERVLIILSQYKDFTAKHKIQEELKGYEMHSEETFGRCMRKLAEDGILDSEIRGGLVYYKLKN